MSFQTNKIRQFWFPFTILAIIVLTVGWILAGVVYPNNVQGNEQELASPNPSPATALPTDSPTSMPTPIATNTVNAVTPSSTPSGNCTYTLSFWSTNSDVWRIENIILGNLSYTKVEALEVLNRADPNPTERLMAQFFSALLNSLKGADSSELDSIMVEARDWLILRPHGLDLTQAEILEVESLTDQLQKFNTGIIGPGRCSDEPITPTPSATFTPLATDTSTPGPTVPFRSPTPTKRSGGQPKPTNTPLPVQPTNTPQPKPTNAPVPTSTPVIPPTPRTPPPNPTESPQP